MKRPDDICLGDRRRRTSHGKSDVDSRLEPRLHVFVAGGSALSGLAASLARASAARSAARPALPGTELTELAAGTISVLGTRVIRPGSAGGICTSGARTSVHPAGPHADEAVRASDRRTTGVAAKAAA
jgi:hypothetical protein